LILRGDRKRCKTPIAITEEARVEEVQLNKLLLLAHSNASPALPKISEQIEVAYIDKSTCSQIGRETAAIGENARRLLFDADENIRQTFIARSLASCARLDLNPCESVSPVQILFARVDICRLEIFAAS
jgi:hypothetical protein